MPISKAEKCYSYCHGRMFRDLKFARTSVLMVDFLKTFSKKKQIDIALSNHLISNHLTYHYYAHPFFNENV